MSLNFGRYYPLRDVVPKVSTNIVGRQETFRLDIDIKKQSLDDIQRIIKDITATETANQERLGNPVSQVIVDNKNNKPFNNVEKKVEVLYGSALPKKAMQTVEQALLIALERSTGRDTGRLQRKAYWNWYLFQDGRVTKLAGAQTFTYFRPGDRVILRPTLNYATVVNNIVANHGTVAYKTKGGGLSMGFLGFAANVAKRNAIFKALTVYAARDSKYSMEGEKSTQGTGFIVIKAQKAKKYRQLR